MTHTTYGHTQHTDTHNIRTHTTYGHTQRTDTQRTDTHNVWKHRTYDTRRTETHNVWKHTMYGNTQCMETQKAWNRKRIEQCTEQWMY